MNEPPTVGSESDGKKMTGPAAMTTDVLLEARGISKSFPGVQALSRVDLDVRRGEVHALVGENGAGKSTLMHILAGVLEPDEGVIRLAGRDVHFHDTRAAQEAGVAMVFQERSLAGPLSAAENVFFARQPVRRWGIIDKARLYRQTREILDDLGIDIDPGTLLEHLSPAQQQMVEIAKALSLDACLLVLDEPTSTLTKTETTTLFRLIERLQQRGAAIIYISHRMAEVFRICDRVTVLRDGVCQGTFLRDEVTAEELVTRMVGRRLGFEEPARAKAATEQVPALDVRDLSDGRLLQSISFVARAGEITALAGLAGSGRTELAMSIFGARPTATGTILVHGQPVKIHSPIDAIEAGVGYLPEDRKEAGLFLEMSVAANVVAASLRRFGRWWLNNRALEQQTALMASRMRLTADPRRRRVQDLSGGNQQKVILARWLLLHPPILIADEPTRGVDVGAKREVHQLLRELTNEGAAVVLISSELPEILAVADRILVMREGRLAGEVPRDEATEESIMRLAAILK